MRCDGAVVFARGDGLSDALLDLLTGAECAGCASPGRVLCRACQEELYGPDNTARLVRPDPCPPGLIASAAAADYDALVRELIVGYKERNQLVLAPVLGHLLALAVRVLTSSIAGERPSRLVLVPVPSRPSTVRARGHDAIGAMVRHAAREMGQAAMPAPLLMAGRVRDQSGLDAVARQLNLAGSMRVRTTALARTSRRHPESIVVICDDVLTTGATAREAQRALESCGVPLLGIATVAATQRRLPPRQTQT